MSREEEEITFTTRVAGLEDEQYLAMGMENRPIAVVDRVVLDGEITHVGGVIESVCYEVVELPENTVIVMERMDVPEEYWWEE